MRNASDQIARIGHIAKRLGVSAEEGGASRSAGNTNSSSGRVNDATITSKSAHTSGCSKSIAAATAIGLYYIGDTIIRLGSKQALGMIVFVAFCLFLISSKRLLGRFVEKYAGTYFIGTGIHLPPATRPSWWLAIFMGWAVLLLPGLLMLLKMIFPEYG